MSKRDVETVATLAAHLALHSTYAALGDVATRGPRAASDALALQRLGRRARNATKRGTEVSYDIEGERIRIRSDLQEALKPYGMAGTVLRVGVGILDLPPNTNLEGAFVI